MDQNPPELPRRLSLVAQTARVLRENLLAGLWQDQLPGERDLCVHLQVSRPTLRSALDELQRDGWLEVTSRKRRRITSLPQATASPPRNQVIAVISPRPLLAMSPSAVVMVDELRTNLSRAGLQLELLVNPACFSAQPERALESLVARVSAAAWLMFGSREPMQRWFLQRQLPCLVAGSCAPGVALPSVDIDYRATCRHAGGLLRRKGHQHLALVLPEGSTGGEADSEQGLREALGDDHRATLAVLCHDGTAPHVCRLLDESLSSTPPPTAFLVARAVHVLTVVTHLQRQGKRLPKDIAIISRDDETFLQHLTPTVARYATNPTQFTRRISLAARQLAETGTLPLRSIRLMPKFLSGETL